MEIHEITCSADADTLVTEHIRNAKVGTSLIESLEDKIDEWTEEFDSLDREVKHREAEDMNHYKLNKIIGLYFLIPTALFYIKNWKANAVEKEVPVFEDDLTKSHKSPEAWDEELWNEDDMFPSDPE